MKGEAIILLCATVLVLMSAVVAQGNGRPGPIKCRYSCADSLCDFNCKRAGYARGTCYRNPLVCPATKGKITCLCYRKLQKSVTGTPRPPVTVSFDASVTPPSVTTRPAEEVSVSDAYDTTSADVRTSDTATTAATSGVE